MVGAWLRPARTASQTEHLTLRAAFGVHVWSLVLTLAAVLVLAGWDRVRSSGHGSFVDGPVRLASDAVEELSRLGLWALLLPVGLGAIEVSWLAAMTPLVAPWGACDEPLRESLRAALRGLWLNSAHWPWLTLLGGGAFIEADASHGVLRALLGGRLSEDLTIAWIVSLAVWNLVVLWRLLANRPVQPGPPTTLCEFCGYNLTGARPDGRCPECGVAVAESLGPEHRPGSPWQRRRELGYWRAWWQSSWLAARRPREFGRMIRHGPPDVAQRRLLAAHVLPAALAMWACLLCISLARGRSLTYDVRENFIEMPVIAVATAVSILLLTPLPAFVVGVWFRLRVGRNLMASAMQVTCHLGEMLVLTASTVGGTALFIASRCQLFRWLRRVRPLRPLGIDPEVLLMICAVLPPAALVLWSVLRATSAARHANSTATGDPPRLAADCYAGPEKPPTENSLDSPGGGPDSIRG